MNLNKILISLILSISFLGCGSGNDRFNESSNNSGNSNNSVATLTGTFIDAPIEGLYYKTASLSGYTNNQGHFQYKTGEYIKFFIGNLEIGNVLGSDIITPLTLSGEYNLNTIGTKATNIARLLQTLDTNPAVTSLLTLPTSLRNLNITTMNLESEADINTIILRAQAITGSNYIIVDSQTAQGTMQIFIQNYTLNSAINFRACMSCHGQYFEREALGRSKVVNTMTKSEVTRALIGYKNGTYGGEMKGLMKGQVARYSDAILRNSGLGR